MVGRHIRILQLPKYAARMPFVVLNTQHEKQYGNDFITDIQCTMHMSFWNMSVHLITCTQKSTTNIKV